MVQMQRVDAIKAGEYKVARPFNIAVKDGLSDAASDFIKFIMSEDGQKVVEDNGYISQGNAGAYTAAGLKGKVDCSWFFFCNSGYGEAERGLCGCKPRCRDRGSAV